MVQQIFLKVCLVGYTILSLFLLRQFVFEIKDIQTVQYVQEWEESASPSSFLSLSFSAGLPGLSFYAHDDDSTEGKRNAWLHKQNNTIQ